MLAEARRVVSGVNAAKHLIWRVANLEKAAYVAWVQIEQDRAEVRHSIQNQDDDLSIENWLELECLSLKTEACRLSEALDQTLDYVKDRCNAIIDS